MQGRGRMLKFKQNKNIFFSLVLLTVLLFVFSIHIYAQTKNSVNTTIQLKQKQTYNCAGSIQKHLSEYIPVKEWFNLKADDEKQNFAQELVGYQTKSKFIHMIITDQMIILRQYEYKFMTEFHFFNDKCTPQFYEIKNIVYDKSTKSTPFTDYDLVELIYQSSLKPKQKFLVYIFSPLMPISMTGVQQAKRISNELGISFHPVLGTSVETKWESSIQELVLPNRIYKLESSILIKEGAELHYPSAVIIQGGRMNFPIRLGYDEPTRFKSYLKGTSGW